MDSQSYWKKREAMQLARNIREETAYAAQINKYYDYMLDQVQKEINGFYSKYAKKEGITLSEAKKRVSQLDIKAYERKAEKYVKAKDFSEQANLEMRLYNATMKINRLEMLKANIGLELVDGFDDLQKYFEQILTERTLKEFDRQAGILGKTIQNNQQMAHSIVNASFNNATFSDRVWMYQDMMKAELSKLLRQGLIQGKNPKALARHLEKLFKVRKSDTERLMRTELTRVQIDAQKRSYERNGYEEYEFIAEPTACPICNALDGKVFKVKDLMPSDNAPPMHPNCRCSTAAYMDREEFDKWLENQEKNDIIKSGARTGARNPYGKAADEHAKKYYEAVRKMTTDVSRIARNTGYSNEQIQAVKNYLFVDKHDLGEKIHRQFDPDYMIAESWKRLIQGSDIKKHDLTLIEHEIKEQKMIKAGVSQAEAHESVSEKFNYGEEALKFYGSIKKHKKE